MLSRKCLANLNFMKISHMQETAFCQGMCYNNTERVYCVPFGESKNGFLILDLPDFAGKEREIRNWICNLGNLSPTRAICTTASQKMTCFLLFDKLCDHTVQNLVVGSSNSHDGTYKTDKERSALKSKII